MKTKAALMVLLLFVCGTAALRGSEAAVNEAPRRPSYYYGYVSGQDYAAEAEISEPRYPDYMPREFNFLPEPEPERTPAEAEPVSADFVPYEDAREQYTEEITEEAAPVPPKQPEQTPAMQDEDGFVPYEYAREKYSN